MSATRAEPKSNGSSRRDGAGNRIRKRVIQPLVGGGADTTDTWYVRDPQGNPMAIYEQTRVVDTLFTSVSEFAIYGSQRIGLCYADQLLRRECLAESCEGLSGDFDPALTQRALLVSEVMYDSPLSPDSVSFEEAHEGEYILLTNVSGRKWICRRWNSSATATPTTVKDAPWRADLRPGRVGEGCRESQNEPFLQLLYFHFERESEAIGWNQTIWCPDFWGKFTKAGTSSASTI